VLSGRNRTAVHFVFVTIEILINHLNEGDEQFLLAVCHAFKSLSAPADSRASQAPEYRIALLMAAGAATTLRLRENAYPSPSSLASTPFTARAQPLSFRSLVAALIAGLKRCSSRQLSANFAGSG
jgi:hypothetical protein